MADLTATLRVVITYLEYAGYRVEDISIGPDGAVEEDGHWLLGWCLHFSSVSLCPHGVTPGLHNLFTMLEGGESQLGKPPRVGALLWTRKSSLMALRVGGFSGIFNDEIGAH